MNKINLLLVDDHILFRLGLRAIISDFEDVNLVADCGIRHALGLVRDKTPDVVLINLNYGINPFYKNIIQEITEISPNTHVLVIGNSADYETLLGAFQQGATGCLLEDTNKENIHNALNICYQGGSYLSPMIDSNLIQNDPHTRHTKPLRSPTLSRQQMHVLRLLSEGLSNQDIADQLVISKRTAEMHVYKIFKELNVTNRAQAINAAIQYGILETNER